MGVYIRLGIIPEKIPAKAWRETYLKSLEFLNGYPTPLMGLRRECVGSFERSVFTRRLENDQDDPENRHWHVVGDFDSMERAESFMLFSAIGHYFSEWKPARQDVPEDIVRDLIKDDTYSNNVFGDKTQGYPYHIAMLAVGMLVESRFPDFAAVSGDIDPDQARIAQTQLRDVLGEEIPLPLSVNAERLFTRISRYCNGPEVLQHFYELSRGYGEDLFRVGDADTIKLWFRNNLRNYQSAGQLGIIGLLMLWLNAEQELKTLYYLACLDEEGPSFDPAEFTKALVSTWVTVPPSTRAALNLFHKPAGATDTVNTQMGSALLDISGAKGRDIRRYIDKQKVSAVLEELFPKDLRRLEKILNRKTREIEEMLSEIREPVRKFERRNEAEPETGDGRSFLFFESVEMLSEIQDMMFKLTAYAASKLILAVAKKPETSQWTVAEIKTRIIVLCKKQGYRLTEDAWAWIDEEENRALLMLLFSYLTIDNHEQSFWNIRTAIFENRKLAQSVLAASRNKAVLADTMTEFGLPE